jgi:uncharacterized protein (DUF433 family)
MSQTSTNYKYIIIDENKVPLIANSGMKVIELIVEKMAYGWSPEELHFQHPHLTLWQIHSALAYYSDHEEELNKSIQHHMKIAEQIHKKSEFSPLRKRLKSKGLL